MSAIEPINAANLESDFAADIEALVIESGDAGTQASSAGYHHGDRWIATRAIEEGYGTVTLAGQVRYPAELADLYGEPVGDAMLSGLREDAPEALKSWANKAFGRECHRDDDTTYAYRVTATETRAGVYAVRVTCEVEAVRGRDRD